MSLKNKLGFECFFMIYTPSIKDNDVLPFKYDNSKLPYLLEFMN